MYPELNANGRSRSTSCQSSAEMRISVNYEAIRQTAWKRRVSYLVSPLLDEGSVVYWWLISCVQNNVHCLFHLAWGQSALKCAAYCLISCSRWQYNSTGVKLMFYYPGQPEHKTSPVISVCICLLSIIINHGQSKSKCSYSILWLSWAHLSLLLRWGRQCCIRSG